MNSQREIKFRAWDTTFKKMHNVGAITFNANGKFDNELVVDNEDWVQIPSYILMQFTGLRDKNGNEIYEGDILRHAYPAGQTCYQILFGEWDNGDSYEDNERGIGWYLQVISSDLIDRKGSITGLLGYPDYKDLEIIGNIYENPELIK